MFFFFFQAEDGIRDLVRSRGLGDVYKRQDLAKSTQAEDRDGPQMDVAGVVVDDDTPTPAAETTATRTAVPVSYTHLTLPTSDLV